MNCTMYLVIVTQADTSMHVIINSWKLRNWIIDWIKNPSFSDDHRSEYLSRIYENMLNNTHDNTYYHRYIPYVVILDAYLLGLVAGFLASSEVPLLDLGLFSSSSRRMISAFSLCISTDNIDLTFCREASASNLLSSATSSLSCKQNWWIFFK